MVKKLSPKEAEKLRRRKEAEQKRQQQPPHELWLEDQDEE